MDEVERTVRYLFILALVLIIVAYWAGANKIFATGLAGVNTLDLTATGRDAQGRFAGYPANAPTN
jgi:hypothetical protein